MSLSPAPTLGPQTSPPPHRTLAPSLFNSAVTAGTPTCSEQGMGAGRPLPPSPTLRFRAWVWKGRRSICQEAGSLWGGPGPPRTGVTRAGLRGSGLGPGLVTQTRLSVGRAGLERPRANPQDPSPAFSKCFPSTSSVDLRHPWDCIFGTTGGVAPRLIKVPQTARSHQSQRVSAAAASESLRAFKTCRRPGCTPYPEISVSEGGHGRGCVLNDPDDSNGQHSSGADGVLRAQRG